MNFPFAVDSSPGFFLAAPGTQQEARDLEGKLQREREIKQSFWGLNVYLFPEMGLWRVIRSDYRALV